MRYLCLFLLLLAPGLWAQTSPYHQVYDWDAKPTYTLPAGDPSDMIALLEKYVVEFAYDGEGDLVEYDLQHMVLWLNSDERMEQYNKIYLPFASDSELLVSKARVITPNGDVVVLDESKILTAKDDESGKTYKYFAFEGLEKGSAIEYLFIEQKDPDYSGRRFLLQSEYEIRQLGFDLYAPKNLVFASKGYNGVPDPQLDTLTSGKLHWQLRLEPLEALEEEEMASYNANRGYVVYKLDRNTANNKSGITSYAGIARNVYNYYNQEPEKRTQERIEALLREQAGIPPGAKGEEAIRTLEQYLKTNIYVADEGGGNLSDLDYVLANSVAGETGIVRLYMAALKTLGIEHQMVLTCDRESLRFDPDFESGNFLTDFLIYFPEFDTYLEPAEQQSRYGFPSGNLMDHYGLFIEEVKLGDFTSAVAKVKLIEGRNAEASTDVMDISIAFDPENLQKTHIRMKRSLSGYNGVFLHPYMSVVKPEDKQELMKNLAQSIDDGITVVESTMENDVAEKFGIAPLVFHLDLTSEALTERAGNRYLFNIGAVIGEQVQMYQEKKRTQPLENDFRRTYYRTIELEIPDGYRIVNPDDLLLDKSYSEEGKVLFYFKSWYEQEGNRLRIRADEQYNMNIVPVEWYEPYREVINSAADFNKITLVLEPAG